MWLEEQVAPHTCPPLNDLASLLPSIHAITHELRGKVSRLDAADVPVGRWYLSV